jgi:hypothetical protein
MKKEFKYFLMVVMVVLLCSMLTACPSPDNKSTPALSPPVANISGSWTNTGTVDENTCGDTVGDIRTETSTIVHITGSNSFTLTNDKGHSYTGTINGKHLSYSGPGENTDCPLGVISTVTLDLQAPDYTTATGHSTDVCKRSSGTCTKNTHLSATCNNCSPSTEANIAGKWTWSRTDNNSCNGVSYESGTFTITQNGSNISLYDALANRTLTGTISGNTISFSGSFAEYGGTSNVTATLTLSADKNSCSGGASWTWTGPSSICTGTKTYTAFTRTSTSAPVITSVSQILPQKMQTITITGSGFGTMAPYTGNSDYIKIVDNSAIPIWTAGYNPMSNSVWLSIGSWSDSQIIITGFAGSYGSNNWVLKSGDQIIVSVWNAQTGMGPDTYTLNVQ